MPKKNNPLVAHEVTTIYPLGNRQAMRKYIVITKSTSNAINLIPLENGEQVIHANEMLGYKVIVRDKK